MTSNETQCDVIQQAIAIGQPLSDAQMRHITACAQCASLQRHIQTLDNLVEQTTGVLVSPGFVERVMARLPASSTSIADSSTWLEERLPAIFSRSRLLRTVALGVAVLVGISQAVQFFFGIFIFTMAVAL